jgi:transposase-like protein
MRYSASDKTEIIRLVEQSHLPARRTLEKLGIPRSSFYRWYDRYQRGGPEALADRPHGPIGSGTVSQRLSAARSSTWRWINPNSARGNWRCASRTRKNTLSQRLRSIGC